MLLIRIITPCRTNPHHIRILLHYINHSIHIGRRIKCICINIYMIFSTCIRQSTKAGMTTTMLQFCIKWQTNSTINVSSAVLRIIIHPNNFNGITGFHLTQRPQAGQQVLLFIVCNDRDRNQRCITLELLQVRTYFRYNHGKSHFIETFLINLQITTVPTHKLNIINSLHPALDETTVIQTIQSTAHLSPPSGSPQPSDGPPFPSCGATLHPRSVD